MPRSLAPSLSRLRSAIVPWPTQATMSWWMTWLVIQRPVAGFLIGLVQVAMAPWTWGSHSCGTPVNDQVMLSVRHAAPVGCNLAASAAM